MVARFERGLHLRLREVRVHPAVGLAGREMAGFDASDEMEQRRLRARLAIGDVGHRERR